jgi:hypothetical protein
MKRYRLFSTEMINVVANTDYTRHFIEQPIKNALIATKSNLNEAKSHWTREQADYTLAKKYFE